MATLAQFWVTTPGELLALRILVGIGLGILLIGIIVPYAWAPETKGINLDEAASAH